MTPETVRTRRMLPGDVPRVVEIERRCFRMAWTAEMFRREIESRPEGLPMVAHRGDQLVGYVVVWWVGPRLHLANIAVGEEARRRGIGTLLVERVFDEARARGCRRVSLETRVSNRGAIGLFRRLGFRTVTISHGYYSDNGEDALVMVCHVPERPSKAQAGAEVGPSQSEGREGT